MLPYNKSLRQLSRNLRNNMTDAEMLLGSRLRGKQLKDRRFYRQKIIGNYIADFYCPIPLNPPFVKGDSGGLSKLMADSAIAQKESKEKKREMTI